MYTHVHPCTLMYTHVHSCTPMYTHVHPCTPMYTHVHRCTLMYNHLHLCTVMCTHVHPCTLTCRRFAHFYYTVYLLTSVYTMYTSVLCHSLGTLVLYQPILTQNQKLKEYERVYSYINTKKIMVHMI